MITENAILAILLACFTVRFGMKSLERRKEGLNTKACLACVYALIALFFMGRSFCSLFYGDTMGFKYNSLFWGCLALVVLAWCNISFVKGFFKKFMAFLSGVFVLLYWFLAAMSLSFGAEVELTKGEARFKSSKDIENMLGLKNLPTLKLDKVFYCAPDFERDVFSYEGELGSMEDVIESIKNDYPLQWEYWGNGSIFVHHTVWKDLVKEDTVPSLKYADVTFENNNLVIEHGFVSDCYIDWLKNRTKCELPEHEIVSFSTASVGVTNDWSNHAIIKFKKYPSEAWLKELRTSPYFEETDSTLSVHCSDADGLEGISLSLSKDKGNKYANVKWWRW